MDNKLDTKLQSIKTLEDEKNLLEIKIKDERQDVFNILEKENYKQYKNDLATVSYVERKTIKFKDKEKVLNNIENTKYFDVIPEEIIPEHKEFSKIFEKDVKSGEVEIVGVEVDVKKSPMIRFAK